MKPALAKNATRPDGRKAFTLPGKNRTEWLTPIEARVRNQERERSNYAGQWTEAPDVPADTVTEPAKALNEKERRQAFSEGLRRDSEIFDARAKAREEATVKKSTATDGKSETKAPATTKAPKADKPAKKEKAPATESKRANFNGLGVCALASYLGHKGGFGPKRSHAILKKAGLDTTEGTVVSYLGSGRRGKNVPTLTNAQAKAVKELIVSVPEVEEAPVRTREERAAAKAKAEKKNGKTPKAEKKGEGKPAKKNGKPKADKPAKDEDEEGEPSAEEREAALAESAAKADSDGDDE